ncbi:MAG: PAS domain S-box protein [Chloroflexi bacterium]|nr:PAS domain S-box protein [Chloroflexota bacterium]
MGMVTTANGRQSTQPEPEQPESEPGMLALARFLRELGAAAEAASIAQIALAFVQGRVGAAAATLHLGDPAGHLALAGVTGLLSRQEGTDRLAVRLGPVLGSNVLMTGSAALSAELRALGVLEVVAEPLLASGRQMGVLGLYWTTPRGLTAEEALLVGVIAEQTAARLASLSLRQPADEAMRGRLVAIVESSEDAIIGKDLDGIITNWNSGAQRLYGYTPEEVIGRPISLLVPPNRPDELPSIMTRLRRGERIEHLETRRVRKDGVELDVSVSISPIRDGSGKIVGAASIARDMTERREAERELDALLEREREARRRAERAVDQLTRLQHVTEALAGAMTMVDIAHAVIERGLPGLEAVAGSMRLLSDDGQSLDLVAAVGVPGHLITQIARIAVTSGYPIAVAVRTGAPAWRETSNLDDERFAEFRRRSPAYPSGAAIPLIADGQVLGGIGLSFPTPRTFSEEDRGFMLALAGQCAQAVQRVRLYQQERAAREQLDAILGGVADGVVVQREDGTFIYANEAAARLTGFKSAREYLGAQTYALSRSLSVADAAGRPFPLDQLPAQRAFRGELAPEMVIQFRRPDTGNIRWSRTQSRIIRGPDGERLAISIFHDMTDEIRSRERLHFLAEIGAQMGGSLSIDETLESLVKAAASTLADWAVVILTAEDGTVEHIASAHRDPAKAVLAGDLHERQLKHASGAQLLWRTIQTGESTLIPEVTDELMAQTARDEEHLALLRAIGLSSLVYAPLTGRGRVQGALAMFMSDPLRHFGEEDQDIAVEIARRASLVLENARLYQQANDAIQARDEFLSIASHELRTPVTAISGVAQVALRARQRGTLDDARLTRTLDQIVRGSQRLVTLTEDLLDVSRLQTGRVELRLEPLPIVGFVSEFVDRFSANLDEQHRVRLEAAPASADAGRGFQVDPARFEQVLANLLTNAVKYTPDGGEIVVTVQDAVENGRDGARITVTDPGIGLPSGAEDAIFQPFGRAPNAMHRQIQGLGLGLYICRQILERHGGRIWAESPGDGHGTTFGLWLPEMPPAEPS